MWSFNVKTEEIAVQDFYRWIDDFMIDEVCQRICDWLMRVFGVTKRVPTAIGVFGSAVGLWPLAEYCLYSKEIFLVVIAWIMIAWVAVSTIRVYSLLTEEFYSPDDSRGGSDVYVDTGRISKLDQRGYVFVLSVAALPPVFTGIVLGGEWSTVCKAYFFAGTCHLLSMWFDVCEDMPRGKTVLDKLKQFLLRPFLGLILR